MPTPTPRSPDARRRPAPVTSTAPLTAALASEGATPASESRAESASAVDASSVDAALAGWSADTSRAQMAWGFAVWTACVSGTRQMREVQREAAERMESAGRQAGERLQGAHDWTEAAGVQAEWLREQADVALSTSARLAEIATLTGMDAVQRAIEGWGQCSAAAISGLGRWVEVQAALPSNAEALQAEAEHVANPLVASPLAWPAQEAMRQGMGMASSLWNDWVNWSQRASASVSRAGAVVH